VPLAGVDRLEKESGGSRPVPALSLSNRLSTGDDAVIVKQIWTANAYRNFNYVIACDETGEALAVDPLDYEKCLMAAKEAGWSITQILNTHEHRDHTGGNEPMVRETGARILAHKNAKDTIADIARGLDAGDIVKVGRTVELEVLDTPGHTMSHVCLLSHTDQPALLCGDTLFNAGAGNCHNGGHPAELYRTFSEQLARLPASTLIYPGHDYIENNLRFTLNREPDNESAQEMLDQLTDQDPNCALVTTLDVERQINTFFRLTSPTVIAKLREVFPDLPAKPDQRTVFLKLRELRNTW
jgi:hydroxyacylglutathione hydrolase